ncbi:hypothetical protein JKP88DRAFT_233999 [Tribonema minus]|uniref:Uncharacterized protein n=1 Tax=Tribonema minus TaxID=303371 RepID=A0A835ZH06_9STRA|nr:hypothetical protein JKP88DRAFT_233999 [Tribonema minus]
MAISKSAPLTRAAEVAATEAAAAAEAAAAETGAASRSRSAIATQTEEAQASSRRRATGATLAEGISQPVLLQLPLPVELLAAFSPCMWLSAAAVVVPYACLFPVEFIAESQIANSDAPSLAESTRLLYWYVPASVGLGLALYFCMVRGQRREQEAMARHEMDVEM